MSSEPSTTDPESQSAPQDQATWWCKILVKIVAVIGAIAVVACSITVFITVQPRCLVAGIWMLLIAIIIIMLEVPFCCQAFEFTKGFANRTMNLRYWHKGLLYCIISMVPVALCFGIMTVAGCAVPFCTGVIYGLMSLGKKASRGEMLSSARGSDTKNFTQFENEAE
ncbi:calcium channel flower homolog [Styela clava]|uniref:calcium channel flower homolog n=1 Tax=Styela clava TaxID=7725 RepID=UPI00193934ED|nr:calcium channel flower homolog [Styela clava]